MTNNINTEAKSPKKGFLRSQRDLIIGLTVVFGVLLIAYFAVIRPLMKDSGEVTTTNVELIWSDELRSGNSAILLFPSVSRDQIKEVAIHNPENDKNYVDWGFYYNEKEDKDHGLTADSFYLTDYEYAAFDENQLSYLVTATGLPLCSSRVEDHCTDYSPYGLDYDPADMAKSTYYTLTTRDGGKHTVLVGSRTPSGTGYYVRSLDEATDLKTGESKQKDSVYVISNVYFSQTVLSTPMAMVTPYLGYPANTAEPLEAFALWIDDDKYRYVPEGESEIAWNAAVVAVPLNSDDTDPFSVFSGMSVYAMNTPKGYYSSTALQNLISLFSDFQGDSVVELGTVQVGDDGEEFIGFTKDTYKKYSLDEPMYQVLYKANGIENVIMFSKLIDDSYYYAYSLTFNVICKISQTNLAFLSWDVETFIQSTPFFLSIDYCQSFAVKGSYFDLGVEQPYRDGKMDVDLNFRMEGAGKNLNVNERNSGKTVDTSLFRKLYTVMLQLDIRKELTPDEIKQVMEKDPAATVTVVTRENYSYKKDDDGNKTSEIESIRPSITRIFRFYDVSNGRTLVTIEDIDQNGKALGENGSFYVMRASLDKLLASALDLMNGVYIDTSIKG